MAVPSLCRGSGIALRADERTRYDDHDEPTPRHDKVAEFVTPKAFDAYAAIARAKGFLLVASSPLTRSSYHAGDDFERLRAAREAKLATAR